MTVIFVPLVFTACEEETVFDTEVSVTRDSDDEEDSKDPMD